MKQTAVNWLIDEAMKLVVQYMQGTLNEDTLDEVIYELGTKAKAMEKEYLERFYNQGYTQCSIEDLKPTSRDRFVDAKDYYNKTFKSE